MKQIVVTGGNGLVGTNLIKKLNQKGYNNIIVIDNYDINKFENLKNNIFSDFLNFENGLDFIKNELDKREIEAIFHIGANADVLEKNPNVMMKANFEHSKFYFEYTSAKSIPFIYASSSAIYGNSRSFKIDIESEDPHNTYSWSKWIFDRYVQSQIGKTSNYVIGLRFFNIFGKGETHKDKNASLPYRFFSFIRDNGFIDLFDVEISRDYVWVEDVVEIIYELFQNRNLQSGIYNLGSGNPITHLELANLVVDEFKKKGLITDAANPIRKIPMPDTLLKSFQFYTKAENLEYSFAEKTINNHKKIVLYINELIDQLIENK